MKYFTVMFICRLMCVLFCHESFVNWKDVAKRVMYRSKSMDRRADWGMFVYCSFLPSFLMFFLWLVPIKTVLEILECFKNKRWVRPKDLPQVLV